MNNISLLKKIKLGFKYPFTTTNSIFDKIIRPFPNKLQSSFPRLVVLYLTNKCNLDCPMCINAAYRNKNIKGINISFATIEKLLPELIKYKPFIYITGGEPLLNPDVFKIINLLSSNKIFTSMTTNGFLLEKYSDEIIKSGLEFISISLDHFEPSFHNEGRASKDSYQRIMKGLEKLFQKKNETPSNIKINTVIRRDNYNILSEMFDFIESLKIDEWSLQHFSFITPKASHDLSDFNKNFNTSYADGILIRETEYLEKSEISILAEQLKKIEIKSKKYRTKVSIKPEIDDLYSYYSGETPDKKSVCTFPFDSVNIIDGNKVSTCMGYMIGCLDDTSLFNIWNSKKANNFRKKILDGKIFPPCFRCCSLSYKFK